MIRLSQNLKSKDTKVYLKTYVYTVLSYSLFLMLGFNDFGLPLSLSSSTWDFDAISTAVYIILFFGLGIFVLPSFLIAHGIISYKRTKKIIAPHILLFVTFALICSLCLYVHGIVKLGAYIRPLSVPAVMTMLSLLVSIITAIVKKARQKNEKIDRT